MKKPIAKESLNEVFLKIKQKIVNLIDDLLIGKDKEERSFENLHAKYWNSKKITIALKCLFNEFYFLFVLDVDWEEMQQAQIEQMGLEKYLTNLTKLEGNLF
ncbi:MAG: hypothetical protein WAR79_00050 [Melioribacteraceae bacterium]